MAPSARVHKNFRKIIDKVNELNPKRRLSSSNKSYERIQRPQNKKKLEHVK
jgi:hypothetical protein